MECVTYGSNHVILEADAVLRSRLVGNLQDKTLPQIRLEYKILVSIAGKRGSCALDAEVHGGKRLSLVDREGRLMIKDHGVNVTTPS